MDDLNVLGWIVLGLLAIVVVVVAEIVRYEERHRRKKPNIRVPKETLWARTHKYYGSDTE